MTIQIGDRPDAEFSDPLQLMTDCHRRIERFLSILEKVVISGRGGHLDHESREAINASLTYFREAAPKHTADEEESLFPRLARQQTNGDRSVAEQIRRLSSDHAAVQQRHADIERLAAQWLQDGYMSANDTGELLLNLAALKTIYASHIQLEDTKLFPQAKRLLGDDELAEIGMEMAARRGVRTIRI